MTRKAIILGAGPIGLVTGWELVKRGWQVDVYERQDIVGGMCRTWRWNEFYVDTGPHIFHTPDKALEKLWEDEFGDLFYKKEFWCKNVQGESFDKYFDYPLSFESIKQYPAELREIIEEELAQRNPEDKLKASTYFDYMQAEVGPTLATMFFQTYPEKLWGISTKDMTAEWAPRRVEFRKHKRPFYDGQWNAVGKYGTGAVYERIASAIKGLGGRIHFNHTVSNFGVQDNEVVRIDFTQGRSLVVSKNDLVISSLPITITSGFLGHKSALQFRGIRSVYLAYDVERVFPIGIDWLYYGDKRLLFNRVTEPKSLSPYLAPKDRTYLTAEITFTAGDEIACISEEQLIESVSSQIQLVGLADRSAVTSGSTNTESFVYPLMVSGYQEELAKAKSTVSRYHNLYSIGTGGEFNYADSQVLFEKAFDTVSDICRVDDKAAYVIRKLSGRKLAKIVDVNGRRIGEGEKAFVIAEAGINHNGSLRIAKELVLAAKRVGCDAVKIQSFDPNNRVSSEVKGAKYAEVVIGTEETIVEMFQRVSLTSDEQRELINFGLAQGIETFSTPFDSGSVDLLEEIGVNLYKIASMDLVNLSLLERVASTGKPVILSTGMSDVGQIDEAVETLMANGCRELVLLQCNSVYPSVQEEMNLKVMDTYRALYEIPVGLSDHTVGLTVAHTAIARGANVIERHFTLNRQYEGPDHILSSESEEMAALVGLAEAIPKILGDGRKVVQPSEYATINQQRKSLYAAVHIPKGTMISLEMVAVKGPAGGLLPRYMDICVGRVAREDIPEDHPITWQSI